MVTPPLTGSSSDGGGSPADWQQRRRRRQPRCLAAAVAAGATWACAVSAFASDDVDAVWLMARRFSVAMAAARGVRSASA